MAYVGTPIDTTNTFQSLTGDRFDGDASETAFTLSTAPSSAFDIEVFVGNVRQDPNSAYTLSGTTLTFTGAPPSGTNNIYVVHQAKAVGTIEVPATNSGNTTFNGTMTMNGGVVFNEESADVDFRVESNGNANMLFVSGGNDVVGIGAEGDLGSGLHVKVSDTGASATSNSDQLVLEKNGNSGLSILSSTSTSGLISFGDSGDNDIGQLEYNHSDNSFRFTTSASERMRITTGGNVGIADTAPAAALEVSPTTSEVVVQATGNSQSNELIRWNNTNDTSTNHTISFFKRNGTTTGSIAHTNNSTSFNTSSDYRLKENQVTLSNGITRLKTLKPYRFNFKTDADKTVDGFFAHEVSSVVPEAITGDKDAVDSEGNVEPQAIDQAKLVPLLTKALQEAITKIETLETEMTALKARVTTLEG